VQPPCRQADLKVGLYDLAYLKVGLDDFADL
jgi:hypothetical protein